MKTLIVKRDEKPIYPIFLTDSYGDLSQAAEALGLSGRRVCIVTDSNVAPLYLEEVKAFFSSAASKAVSFVVPAGEEHKNLDTVRTIYEFLIQESFDRKDLLVALGGGVIGDMTGFTAATYLRGIDFIQMPTTLLSQVDSSIGGKTGVDFDAYKNMVGAFYMPKLVYINAATLTSLSSEQFASGMGEVVKHGCIRSAEYFDFLLENKKAIEDRDLSVMLQVVEGSCRIKRAVVEEDPTEQGVRAILNFGHTIGHAVEKEKDFTMAHGACVGAGCAAAAWLSLKKGLIDSETYQKILDALTAFSLPVKVGGIDCASVMEAVRHDKKMAAGRIKFILLDRIGNAFVDKNISFHEMEEALASILEETV